MGLFIALIIVVAVVEMILSYVWDFGYFRSGIPIFKKYSQGSIISFPVSNSYKIETLVQDEQYADLEFRKVQDIFLSLKKKRS